MSDVTAEAIGRYRNIAVSGDRRLERWFYKEVTYSWLDATCRFGLSHSVFSSDRVDDGSKMLLDSIATRVDDKERWSGCRVYDVGCGMGVLGIVAAAALRAGTLILEDRDSLSVALACLNAWKNELPAEVLPNPAPTGIRTFEPAQLVLCNLPAKAGASVHRLMIDHAVHHLSSGGLSGFVVVRTLANAVEEHIAASPVTYERIDASAHVVFIFSRVRGVAGQPRDRAPNVGAGDSSDSLEALPSVYKGVSSRFRVGNTGYALTTVEGLPEYDGPSYLTRMLMKLTLEYVSGQAVLVVDNGPGHLVAAVSKRSSSVCCASRNALAGYAHAQLLPAATGRSRTTPSSVVAERPAALASRVPERGIVILPISPEPYTPVFDELIELFESVRDRESQCIVAGNSSTISRLEKLRLPLSIRRRSKSRGVRGLIFVPA
ncbi:MAG: methyltransferase [Spirochaetales bacterium]